MEQKKKIVSVIIFDPLLLWACIYVDNLCYVH